MRKMKKATPKYIMIKLFKTHDKNKILKNSWVIGGKDIYRGTKIRILADFLLKQCKSIFNNRAISSNYEKKNPTNPDSIPGYCVIKNVMAFVSVPGKEPHNVGISQVTEVSLIFMVGPDT